MTPRSRPAFVCEHVLLDPADHRLWFTGRGLTRCWACVDCARRHPAAPAWCPVDDAWWAQHVDRAGAGSVLVDVG